MKRPIAALIIFYMISLRAVAQNNLRLYSARGETFKVWMNGSPVNIFAQASVLLENLQKDTVSLRIEFENSTPEDVVFYLLEKGKRTKKLEYNYRLSPGTGTVKSEFTGFTDPARLADPIVPPAGRD